MEKILTLWVKKQLSSLDADNKVITGELAEKYILHKTNFHTEPTANDGYTLQTFTGNDNNEYNIIFNTNTQPPTVLIESGEMKKMLTQSNSWAKGSEYAGYKAKLNVQEDKATLTLDNKKIVLKGKN